MWKKITSNEAVAAIIVGNVITDKPNDPSNQYQIISIHEGAVRGLHVNGKVSLVLFPEDELTSGNWWVKT